MEFREINVFERQGLIKILRNNLGMDIENIICGTNEKGGVNLQNTFVSFRPNDEFPNIGAVGLTESNDIILEYWNLSEEESMRYWISERDTRNNNPLLTSC